MAWYTSISVVPFAFSHTLQNLVKNLTLQFPDANIWLVGHSLGGALASLLGTTFGFPVVAFESPGERLAAQRLHLPLPPVSDASGLPITPVTHVYHNADPIPQGACTGFRSVCASAGYALETRCHLGKSIIYDTVGKLGWRVSVQSHPIKEVILRVLEGDQQWGEGRDVPLAVEEIDCVVRPLSDFVCLVRTDVTLLSRTVINGSLANSRTKRHDTIFDNATSKDILFVQYLDTGSRMPLQG